MSYKIWLQFIVPQHALSRLVGLLAKSNIGWIKNTFIQWFIKHYQVNMSEAEETDGKKYPSFNAFFTRGLKADARSIAYGEKNIVSPADGCISQIGRIQDTQLIQAKGKHYQVKDLVGGNTDDEQFFVNGSFTTIYLSPKDYHRVHMPVSGTLRKTIYIPGKLFSVNPATAENVNNLFARNERLVCLFDTAQGPMASIMVGAMIVAGIQTVWGGKIAPNKSSKIIRTDYAKGEIELRQGDEMGFFNLGSTVVLLFSDNQMQWTDSLREESVLKMGELIGNS